MPYAHGPSVKKLSKMATLLLARNYILMMGRTLEHLRRLLAEAYNPMTPALAAAKHQRSAASAAHLAMQRHLEHLTPAPAPPAPTHPLSPSHAPYHVAPGQAPTPGLGATGAGLHVPGFNPESLGSLLRMAPRFPLTRDSVGAPLPSMEQSPFYQTGRTSLDILKDITSANPVHLLGQYPYTDKHASTIPIPKQEQGLALKRSSPREGLEGSVVRPIPTMMGEGHRRAAHGCSAGRLHNTPTSTTPCSCCISSV